MTEKNQSVIQWNPDAKIEITGLEYDAFQKVLGFFEQFIPALQVKNEILKRMLEQGIAKEFDTSIELTKEESTEIDNSIADSLSEEGIVNPS